MCGRNSQGEEELYLGGGSYRSETKQLCEGNSNKRVQMIDVRG